MTLSVAPTNHFACGSFHSENVFHGVRKTRSGVFSRQNVSGSSSDSLYIDVYCRVRLHARAFARTPRRAGSGGLPSGAIRCCRSWPLGIPFVGPGAKRPGQARRSKKATRRARPEVRSCILWGGESWFLVRSAVSPSRSRASRSRRTRPATRAPPQMRRLCPFRRSSRMPRLRSCPRTAGRTRPPPPPRTRGSMRPRLLRPLPRRPTESRTAARPTWTWRPRADHSSLRSASRVQRRLRLRDGPVWHVRAGGESLPVREELSGSEGTWSCGLAGNEDCCTSRPVPGGSYNRFSDPAFPATVSAFNLDVYEVTVGRLRAFFEATAGNPRAFAPAPGAAARPKSPTAVGVRRSTCGCPAARPRSTSASAPSAAPRAETTQTEAPRRGPTQPARTRACRSRASTGTRSSRSARGTAGAFRPMPSGASRRKGATSSDSTRGACQGARRRSSCGAYDAVVAASLWDPANQVYKFSVGTPFRLTDPVTGKVNDGPAHMSPPGRKTGYGKWGHADLTGNVLEYLLDVTPTPPGSASTARASTGQTRRRSGRLVSDDVVRGRELLRRRPFLARRLLGSDTIPPQTAFQYDYPIARTYYAAGGRCAR